VKSVLIAEDSPLIRRLLRAALTACDWIVCEEAENGRDAVVKAQELHPDVIVLDMTMPEMNGLQAARILKRVMPATPLLLFTTHSVANLEPDALAAGFQKVISKSDGPAAVISAILSLVA
jgi:DNA-binding NarL/FixJ family response regulator